MAALLASWIEHVLTYTKDPLRFESWCCKLLTEVCGQRLMPTSRTWDLGRDAVPAMPVGQAGLPVLCASLDADPCVKFAGDARRLAETTDVTMLLLCSNQVLTEQRRDQVTASVRQSLPRVSEVGVYGLAQLVHLASEHEDTFLEFYRADVAEIREALGGAGEEAEDSLQGLRIALAVSLQEEAEAIRNGVAETAALLWLERQDRGVTLSALGKGLSDAFHLPHELSTGFVLKHVSRLVEEGWAERSGDIVTITQAGRAVAAECAAGSYSNEKRGRELIREELRKLTGKSLSEGVFDQVWRVLLVHLPRLFHDNGMSLVNALAALASAHAGVQEQPRDLHAQVQSVAWAVACCFEAKADQRLLARAVEDMFTDRDSSAFQWLCDLAVAYVCVCAMGLEPQSSNEMRDVLRRTGLLLDTDIVLSALCVGEPNHEEVHHALKAFGLMGGPIHVHEQVLLEVAYHAWIADNDFRAVYPFMGKITPGTQYDLIENAFVRAYWRAADGRYTERGWGVFLAQFKGAYEDDYRRIGDRLVREYNCALCEPAHDHALANAITNYLLGVRSRKGGPRRSYAQDKCSRDGVILATLEEIRRNDRRAHPLSRHVVVSSSVTLRMAAEHFRLRLAGECAVLPMGGLAFMTTLVPGAPLTLSGMGKALFDLPQVSRLPTFDKAVVRAATASEQYNWPWSNRANLLALVEERVVDYSTQIGADPEQAKAELLKHVEERPQELAQIVGAAIDELVKSELEIEVEKLKREVREREDEIRRLRRRQ